MTILNVEGMLYFCFDLVQQSVYIVTAAAAVLACQTTAAVCQIKQAQLAFVRSAGPTHDLVAVFGTK